MYGFSTTLPKNGKHLIPDHNSRTVTTCNSPNCQIEKFLEDIPTQPVCMSLNCNLTFSDFLFNEHPICSEISLLPLDSSALPFGSKNSWKDIQQSSDICKKFIAQKKDGTLPSKSDKDKNQLNFLHKESEVKDGLIVQRIRPSYLTKERTLIYIPPSYLESLLTLMHIKFAHPSLYQLENIFHKYFLGQLVHPTCEKITNNCGVCLSVKQLPKFKDIYNPLTHPEHPGSHMNTDIMKRAGQNILVTTDMFSGFTSACILASETKEELIRGILLTTTPLRHSSKLVLRTDQATGFQSLHKTQHSDLVQNGIMIELGDDGNKNSNTIVDKRIQELELELKKIQGKEVRASLGTLCEAVSNLNNRIRQQGLTSAQIHFSRDVNTGENLLLNDGEYSKEKRSRKQTSNISTSKLKEQTTNMPEKGDLVFVRDQCSKHEARDPHLVLGKEGSKVLVQKILHSNPSAIDSKSIRFSHKRSKIERKFLFLPPNKMKTGVKRNVVSPQNKESSPRYVIPQRRSVNKKTTPHWLNSNPDEDSDDDFWDESHGYTDSPLIDIPSPPQQVDRHQEPLPSPGGHQSPRRQPSPSYQGGSPEFGSPPLTGSRSEPSPPHPITGNSSPVSSPSHQSWHQQPLQIDQSKFPKRGDFIRIKRKIENTSAEDDHIPTNNWTVVKITHRHKSILPPYFNIEFEDGSSSGIYLIKGHPHPNNLIWSLCPEESYNFNQVDGPPDSPKSLTPASPLSPQPTFTQQEPYSPVVLSPEWDNSFTALTNPLELNVLDNNDDELEAALQPRALFSTFSSSLYPTSHEHVDLERVNNLSHVLDPNRPLVSDVVHCNERQLLDRVLRAVHPLVPEQVVLERVQVLDEVLCAEHTDTSPHDRHARRQGGGEKEKPRHGHDSL